MDVRSVGFLMSLFSFALLFIWVGKTEQLSKHGFSS